MEKRSKLQTHRSSQRFTATLFFFICKNVAQLSSNLLFPSTTVTLIVDKNFKPSLISLLITRIRK